MWRPPPTPLLHHDGCCISNIVRRGQPSPAIISQQEQEQEQAQQQEEEEEEEEHEQEQQRYKPR